MTLPVLRTLRLQGNEVATLPLGVTAMYALNVLDLRANPLTTVLPDEYTDKDGIERLIQAVKDAYGTSHPFPSFESPEQDRCSIIDG